MNIYSGSKCAHCGRVARDNDQRPFHRCQKCSERLEPYLESSSTASRHLSEKPEYDKYKTFWRRLLAGVIDSCALLAMTFPMYYFADKVPLQFGWGVAILSVLLGPSYFVICHNLYGQTIGKYFLKIRVQDMVSGSLLTLRKSIFRSIVPVIVSLTYCTIHIVLVSQSWFDYYLDMRLQFTLIGALAISFLLASFLQLCWYVLELITMLLNRKRRAIHDYLAGSVVVII